MSKYQKGETSEENLMNSKKITNSIISKTKLLTDAIELDTLPSYIPLNDRGTKLNIGDVHSWENKELRVFKYAGNTAKTKINEPFLDDLIDAIHLFNKKMHKWRTAKEIEEPTKKKSKYKTREDLEYEIDALKKTQDILKNNIVEVFRAYEQLKSFIVTHHFDNKQYHNILKSHFHVNPKDRLKLIK
jgi:5'-3' exonuclease